MERPTSRGNVAIAALFLVVGVGVAAIAFDSLRESPVVAIVPESQVAQAAQKDRGVCIAYPGGLNDKLCTNDEDQKKKCKMGEDYIIMVKEGKDATNKEEMAGFVFLTNDGVTNRGTNQCLVNGTLTVNATVREKRYNGVPIPERKCQNVGPANEQWKCYITYCHPVGFTEELLKKDQVCVTLPTPVSIDGVVDPKASAPPSFSKAIEIAALKGTPEEQENAKKFITALPDSTTKPLNDAFEQRARTDLAIVEQEKIAAEEFKRKDEALEKLVNCEKGVDEFGQDDCRAEEEAAQVAIEKSEAEQERLEQLRKQAQGLGDGKALPDTTGSIKPPPGKVDPAPRDQNTFDPNSSPYGGGTQNTSPSSGSGFNFNQFMPLLGGLMKGFLQKSPSCTITANPKSISQPGQPVTLTWRSENAAAAYLSFAGQAGPSGSATINPQQTTTYSMQVIGYPQQGQQQYSPYGQQYNSYGQQQYNPYGYNPYGYQQQDPYCIVSTYPSQVIDQRPAVPGCLNYRGSYGYGIQQQNPYSQLGQQLGQMISGNEQQAQCSVQVTVGANAADGTNPASGEPKAQIACQPKVADVGMQIGISYACQNSTASKGDGFSTGNELSGTSQITVAAAATSSATVSYGLTCTKEGKTDSAQCTIGVNTPTIALVSIPKNVKSGEAATIGWVTGAIESCVISSPSLQQFTDANKSNAVPSGSAKTPLLKGDAKFVLTCTTKAGGTKVAEELVEVD